MTLKTEAVKLNDTFPYEDLSVKSMPTLSKHTEEGSRGTANLYLVTAPVSTSCEYRMQTFFSWALYIHFSSHIFVPQS